MAGGPEQAGEPPCADPQTPPENGQEKPGARRRTASPASSLVLLPASPTGRIQRRRKDLGQRREGGRRAERPALETRRTAQTPVVQR